MLELTDSQIKMLRDAQLLQGYQKICNLNLDADEELQALRDYNEAFAKIDI